MYLNNSRTTKGGDSMSKKKLRYKKHSKSHKKNISAFDHHHLLWTRARWNGGALRELRLYWYCIILIPRDTLHRHIHANMCFIPVISQNSARYALNQLNMLDKAGALHEDDPIEKRLNLLAALFDYVEQETADALRKQLQIVCEFKKAPN